MRCLEGGSATLQLLVPLSVKHWGSQQPNSVRVSACCNKAWGTRVPLGIQTPINGVLKVLGRTGVLGRSA
jgi:hypothetical protein